MHEQTIIQNRVVDAEPSATPEVALSSLEGTGCELKLTAGEQNKQSLIDAVQSWLAAREVIQVNRD